MKEALFLFLTLSISCSEEPRNLEQNDSASDMTDIMVGGKRIVIPTPIGFKNASETSLGKNLSRLKESPMYTNHLFFIRERDFNNLKNKNFPKDWKKDPFSLVVRHINEGIEEGYTKEEFLQILEMLRKPDGEVEKLQQELLELEVASKNKNFKDFNADKGTDIGSYEIQNLKQFPPYDIKDDSFAVLFINKSRLGDKVVSEIILQSYVLINQKMLILVATSLDSSKISYMKEIMEEWTKAVKVNQSSN